MPTVLAASSVQEALARRLAAPDRPSDGVVWVKDGDEVIVWLDSLSVRLEPGMVRIRVELETDQTGRAPQDVVIAVAEPSAPPSFLAVSDEAARGPTLLTARWGRTLQDAVWAALVDLAGDEATGIAAATGTLILHTRGPG